MDVLVVGASGFIGKHICRSFHETYTIHALFRNKKFEHFLDKHHISVHRLNCDLLNRSQIESLLNSKYDVCIYLAGNTSPRDCANNRFSDVNDNILALINLLDHLKAEKFIYFSSGSVYMDLNGLVSPESRLNPTIPYAISKSCAEYYVQFYQRKVNNISEYVILRFFGAYGPYEPERKITTRFLTYTGDEFIIYGNGKNFIDFMYVDDAVHGLKKVIESDKANLIVDFCSGRPMTINELLNQLVQITGKNLKIKHKGTVPEYIKFYASPRKMKMLYDFEPKISLEDGVKQFIQFLKR